MEIEVGKTYKTYGKWKATVIWKCHRDSLYGEECQRYIIIHKPGDQEESHAVVHDYEGRAITGFSVNEAPRYNMHLPADLMG